MAGKFFIWFWIGLFCARVDGAEPLMEGDIVFQSLLLGQGQAIQAATHSKYTHMGLILEEQGSFYVLEASNTVRTTPLNVWIRSGDDGKYVVKRLKNAAKVLSAQTLAKMRAEGERLKGKSYDLTFGWSDEKIYCSELVWKIYQRGAGLEIGKLQKLGEFDLSSAVVQEKLKERYGDSIPLDEIVISPASMFESELLRTVESKQ
ncbi:MAG: YiiX family permuted papain-like enzyme [Burkholderiaceae bacterium]|nr:YiiX family permuted papain-like enzyme [Burkholderiaceae bacterium]